MSGVRIFDDQTMRCPFCDQDADLTAEDQRCSRCGLPVPEEVRRLRAGVTPLIVQTFGSSRHGKTTYLCALTMILSRMANLWDGYSIRAVTQRSRMRIREVNNYARTGSLPPPNTEDGDEPTILMLRRVGEYGDRLLVYRDGPGEPFDDIHVDPDRVPFLRSATATFLIASVQDLEERSDGRSLDMLMDSLVASLENQDVDLERESRCAIVVLTKGDAVVDLPDSLRSRLASDPLWPVLNNGGSGTSESRDRTSPLPNEPRYLEDMREADNKLREWVETRRRQGGPNLVRIADDNGIILHFSLVSATGSEPDEANFLTVPWKPRRVIDPLLWALEFRPPRASMLDLGYRRISRRLRLLWD